MIGKCIFNIKINNTEKPKGLKQKLLLYSLPRQFLFTYISISLSSHLYLGNPQDISTYLIRADLTDTSIAERFIYL